MTGPLSVAGGTGNAPDHGIVGVMPAAIVEEYGDLHEYGLSLGVDLDAEGEEDLVWVVQQAFNAPLPSRWTEYVDDTGRAYYIKDGSTESTWEHPMDSVYRELLDLIKNVRQRRPAALEAQRRDLVRQHLQQVHQRAKADLEGWSGPYSSEQGDYYYSESLKLSTWDHPVAEWERELALRHAVLARYLIPEHAAAAAASPGGVSEACESSHNLLQALRLQLGNLHRADGMVLNGGDAVPEPSTARSYHTARSQGSSRSGRTKQSEGHKERKERKSHHEHHREHRTSEERNAKREARAAATGGPGEHAYHEPTAEEPYTG